MPAPVSNLPQGLLSILGLQNFGEAPRLLQLDYQPVLECLDLFKLQGMTSIAAAPVAAVAGGGQFFGNTFFVPQTELWWVHRYSISLSTGPAMALTACPMCQFIGFNQPIGPYLTNGASETGLVAGSSGFWLPAGGNLGFATKSVTGAATVAAYATVTRYRA